MKTMLTTFFDIKGTVHFGFIPEGQIVNQAYYVEILKWLREAVYRKRPEVWPND
jgi:acyl-CoA thioesterase FadM